ncbi:efflux RND transporter permease subunit [Spirosoma sp. 209]|uniref:efflux RND transporter permease subunit n=1 Tax=Spirosoma sp. 209 TaxID=1955701 RepID=UPI00098CF3D7|nr:efflux RND transporter permease subunit [Spirosoma sp. 209]
MNLTQLSITRPILIIVLFLVLGIVGLFSYTQLRYELLPNIATPFVTVATVWPGASPGELESSITRPVEEAVSTADKVKRITAQSLENISLVTIEFRQEADADKALQETQRRVNDILAKLPAGSKTPQVSKYSLTDLPVLRVAITSQLPPLELGTLLKNQIKPRLAQVPGVGQVSFVGLAETEVAVDLDVRRLEERRLSVLQVTNAIRQANLNVPAGNVKDHDALYSVRVVGKTDELSRLRSIVVSNGQSRPGQTIRLGEIGTIRTQARDAENINRYNGRSSVGLLITKQSGANNVEISQRVRAEMQTLQTDFSAQGLHFDVAQDGSEFTLAAAEAVNHDLFLAIGLVALVMFVFLHSLRSSLIVMVAIPASLLSTFVFMNLLGFSLNLLTLLALSLVVGILVDDSIVVLENIYKQLEHGKEKRQAALDGRNEIGFAALAITLVDVVVFVPLSLAPGLIGDLMREFALVVVISTLFSLLVSFTLTPMIASRFGRLEPLTKYTLMGRFSLWFERQYDWISNRYLQGLAWALEHRKTVASLVLVLFVGALWLPISGFIGTEFTAPADKGEVQVIAQLPDGAKLEQTDAMAKRLESAFRRMPEVTKVFTNVGANPDGFVGVPTTHTAELNLTFKPREERTRSLAQLSRQVKEIIAREPGVRMRVSPIGLLGSDATQPISVIVNGADRAQVQQQARRIGDRMRSIPGTADIRLSGESLKPEVQISVDPEKLARYGLTTEEVGGLLRTALAGYDDLTIQQNDVAVTVRVRLQETDRNRTATLRRLTLINPAGQPVALHQIAEVRDAFMPALLERKDRSNAVTIYSQVIGRPVGAIGEDIRQAVTALNVPPDVRITYGGDLELQDDAFGKLGLVFGAAILFMYLIMVALYNSWLYPFVVLFSIPVAVVGALLALALTMNSLNVFSLLGMIMMLGLVAKNAILLVERANENREAGMTVTDALLDAGQTRLRPILMTTLAMVIGMLPIALASGPGAELKTGLAWALIGGLSSSMFLTLVLVPTVYLDVTRLRVWAKGLRQKGKAVGQGAKGNRAGVATMLAVTFTLQAAHAQLPTQSPLTQVPASHPYALSLQDAVDRVRRVNGEVVVAQLEVDKADARLEEVRRAALPTFSATGQYQHNIKPPVFFFPAVNIDPATGSFAFDNNRLTPVAAALPNGYTGAVNVTMPLIQPDLRISRRLASNGQQQAQQQVRVVANRQVAEVKKLYLSVLLAQAQQQLVRQSMARADEALRETRNLLRVQLATDADTLRAFVERENQRPNLSKLERTIRQLTGSLATLLDLPSTAPLVLTDSLTLPDPGPPLTDPNVADQALTRRPELRLLALSLEQIQRQTELERSRSKPTLGLFGQLSTQSQMSNFDFGRSRWPLTAFLGVQLTLPIWNPTLQPKVRQARLAYFQAGRQLAYNRALIRNEVTYGQYAVEEARERLTAQGRTIAAAERSYALVRSRYRQGLARWSEVADAELALRQAQSNRVQALYDVLIATVELDKAVGND